jgi:hypothetical protein
MYRTRTTRLALDLRNEVGLSQGWLTTPLLGVDRRVFDWEPDGTFWLFDDTDGFIFEEQQFSLSYNVEAWRLLDSLNFNADQLDGQGPSGVVIDPNQGYIFAIRFSGYSVSFYLRTTNMRNGKSSDVLLHTHSPGSSLLDHNNLPLTVTLSNGGTVAPGRIYVTGRSYGVMGRYKDTMYRSVGAFVQDINPYDPSTGTYALMSVRIKQG